MRIAVIAPDDLPVPPVRGGSVETTVDALTTTWSLSHRVGLCSPSDPELPEREETSGLMHRRVPRGAAYVERCVLALTGVPWDVLVVFNRPGWVARLAELLPGPPVVLSLHSNRLDWLSGPQARRCVRAAKAIVTVSDHLRRSVCRRHPGAARKTLTIYTGVDAARFTPAEGAALTRRLELRRQHRLADAPVVLYTARFAPVKGLDRLLRTMRRVVRNSPARLLLVGDGWLPHHHPSAYLRRVTRQAAGLEDRVVRVGFVPPSKVHEYFWAADILACPSRRGDVLPRAVYEGMAASLPVVAFADTAVSEVVRHRREGLLVRDTRGLARALRRLAREPALARQLGEAGRRRVLDRFCWHHAAARWEEVFATVTGTKELPAGKENRPRHLP